MLLPNDIRRVFDDSDCIYTHAQIEQALDKMARELAARLSEKAPVFICIVIGGMITFGNLLTRLNFPLTMDYIHATRYQGKETPESEIVFRTGNVTDLRDRTVVLVDDILDEGVTLARTIEFCKKQQAKEILTVVLLDKKKTRKPGGLQSADVVGLTVDDRYVFGFGLDYKEYLRNVPGIYAVHPKDITS
jgi:hypoxanthine phosphoribosyltransferase